MAEKNMPNAKKYAHYINKNINAVCRLYGAEKVKPIWLISEHGHDAGGNSLAFFEYMIRNHPEIETLYLISTDDPDYKKVKAISYKTVEPESERHYDLMYLADALISSYPYGFTPDPDIYYSLAEHHLFKPKGLNVFLQNRILSQPDGRLSWQNYKPDLFETASPLESDYVINTLKQPKGNIMDTGMCSYDKYKDFTAEKQILILPGIQPAQSDTKSDDSVNLLLFQSYKKLVCSAMWDKLPVGWDVVLCLPPAFRKATELFDRTDKVSVIFPENITPFLEKSSILITDNAASSAVFDMLFMKKPVFFYEYEGCPASGSFFKPSKYGTASRHATNILVYAIKQAWMLDSGITDDDLHLDLFYHHDHQNCERTYQAVQAKLKQRQLKAKDIVQKRTAIRR